MFRLYGLLKGRLDLQTKGSGGLATLGKHFFQRADQTPILLRNLGFYSTFLFCVAD